MSISTRDHLKHDLDEYARDILQSAYYITLAVIFLTASLFPSQQISVVSLVVLLAGLALSALLRTRQRLSAASITYVGTLIAATTALIVEQGLTDHRIFLFLLPVIAASALLGERGNLYTAALVMIIMFTTAWARSDLMATFRFAFVPALLCVMMAAVNTANTRNLLGLVEWAIDIQSKDTQRAEAFYAQKEKLEEALLKLQHAKSALEHINTRLEQTNLKLEHAEQVALQASQAKSTFMSNMSHELRTPLNVIIGYSSSMLNMPQMFNDVPLPTVYREYVELIENSGHYLLELINDTLDLSKIEAGKLSLHPENVNLPPLLKGVIATSIGLVKEKPILIRPNFDEALPTVYADPTRVRQILLNLLSNAIKFTSSGSVTLSAVAEGDMMHISITDTGIGIPEYALEHIFDRYQQAEQDTDKRYGGTGLGLDISKQLCLMHGGDLTVKSVVGKGSTFTFTLPLSRSVLANRLLHETTEAFSVANESVGETYLDLLLVLLVEDQNTLREVIRKTLEMNGYHVIVTSDSHETADMADALLPALIILDTNLEEIDGWQIYKELHGNPETQSIPVILCTDTPMVDCPPHVICLEKPITPQTILTAAHQLAPVPQTNKSSPDT